jgi:hypothetical protein
LRKVVSKKLTKNLQQNLIDKQNSTSNSVQLCKYIEVCLKSIYPCLYNTFLFSYSWIWNEDEDYRLKTSSSFIHFVLLPRFFLAFLFFSTSTCPFRLAMRGWRFSLQYKKLFFFSSFYFSREKKIIYI